MEHKSSYLPSPTGTKNTRWETAAVCISVAEDSIRKATDRFNTPLECWGCTNSPRYHAERFHTYRNFPNKRDTDVNYQAKHTIQYYNQRTYMMGGSGGACAIQGKWGQTSSMAVLSISEEQRFQLTRSWKEEWFGYLDQALLICEMMEPYTPSPVRLLCAGHLKGKYYR